ncbi:Uncharacterised protein [Bacillus paranthracis]|nr:Uncharacterised protein [Bacillus paranthracis]
MKRNTKKYPYPILIKESSDNKIEDFGSGFGFSSARISSTSSVIFTILNVNSETMKNKKRKVIIVNNTAFTGV